MIVLILGIISKRNAAIPCLLAKTNSCQMSPVVGLKYIITYDVPVNRHFPLKNKKSGISQPG